MKNHSADTIAAVATAAGEGALAIVRMSGARAIAVADRVFRGKSSLASADGYTVHIGDFVNEKGAVLDHGLATIFRAPRSYTGEDSVEFSCHGGIHVTASVLNAVLCAGARHATAGEFTRRAFLNGKLDLSQAEAVAALIAARSDRARRASLEQLEGKLGDEVRELRGSMTHLCALLELELDFSEEGIDIVDRQSIAGELVRVCDRLDSLAETFTRGRLSRDGATVVIAGEPNAGKSTLFNMLLKESRAIVTAVPGTTRDFLEESIVVHGVLLRLIDTAGLRQSDDPVEREGILRSRNSIQRGDVILLVEEVCIDPSESGRSLGELNLSEYQIPIIVRNKIDRFQGQHASRRSVRLLGKEVIEVSLSAKTGDGVPVLQEAIVQAVGAGGEDSTGSVEITNKRHWQLLRNASQCLRQALSGISSGITNEFIAFDVREATKFLGEITGEVTSDNVLDAIFEKFCIGK
jgi:tRNA modification GTPase